MAVKRMRALVGLEWSYHGREHDYVESCGNDPRCEPLEEEVTIKPDLVVGRKYKLTVEAIYSGLSAFGNDAFRSERESPLIVLKPGTYTREPVYTEDDYPVGTEIYEDGDDSPSYVRTASGWFTGYVRLSWEHVAEYLGHEENDVKVTRP